MKSITIKVYFASWKRGSHETLIFKTWKLQWGSISVLFPCSDNFIFFLKKVYLLFKNWNRFFNISFFHSRPNDSFFTFMGPLTMLRYLIWEPYKWLLLKALVVALLLLILGLFLYSMPVCLLFIIIRRSVLLTQKLKKYYYIFNEAEKYYFNHLKILNYNWWLVIFHILFSGIHNQESIWCLKHQNHNFYFFSLLIIKLFIKLQVGNVV